MKMSEPNIETRWCRRCDLKHVFMVEAGTKVPTGCQDVECDGAALEAVPDDFDGIARTFRVPPGAIVDISG